MFGNNSLAFGQGNTIASGHNNSMASGTGVSTTASNQFVVGTAARNAGAVTTEVVVSDSTWSVRINGVAYTILLKA